MGGHLPGEELTQEVARIRGRAEGVDIHSPARFDDIAGVEGIARKVEWLRKESGGKPIGIKVAAGKFEADLELPWQRCLTS